MTITVEQYIDAISNVLSDQHKELLGTLYKFPNSKASAKELAAAMNFKSFHAANRQIGQIGKEIANFLQISPPTYYYGELERPAYFLLVGPYYSQEGSVRSSVPGWEMVDNLRKAIEILEIHKNIYSSEKKHYYLQYHNADKLGYYPTPKTDFKTRVDLLTLDYSVKYKAQFFTKKNL